MSSMKLLDLFIKIEFILQHLHTLKFFHTNIMILNDFYLASFKKLQSSSFKLSKYIYIYISILILFM